MSERASAQHTAIPSPCTCRSRKPKVIYDVRRKAGNRLVLELEVAKILMDFREVFVDSESLGGSCLCKICRTILVTFRVYGGDLRYVCDLATAFCCRRILVNF
jgi:hypothetical protein